MGRKTTGNNYTMHTIEQQEGLIKFKHIRTGQEISRDPLAESVLDRLVQLRNIAYQKRLIGKAADGYPFGNLSVRLPDNRVLITASGTGKLETISTQHFCEITEWDLDGFYLKWLGRMPPSSETFSHLALYNAIPEATTILHTHREDWNIFTQDHPGTDQQAANGSSFIAEELLMVGFIYRSELPLSIFMRGHPPGWMLIFPSLGSLEEWLVQKELTPPHPKKLSML